jgi:hypothetical protein
MNISDYIAQADQATIDSLFRKLQARQNQLRADKAAENARKLEIGSEVTLTGLKPKYLNGARAQVLSFPSAGKVEVQLRDMLYRNRSSRVTLPLSCLIVKDPA